MNVSIARILVYSLLMLVLTAVFIELAGVLMGTVSETGRELGSSALSVPVFWAFLLLLFFTVLLKTLARYELLSRAELLCILFAGLMASPIMTVGFWRYLVPNVATFPRSENFEFLDAINPNLWPHGPNLTEGILTQPTVSGIETEGSIRWESLSLSDGRIEQAPVIEQAGESDNSRLLVRLPAGQGRKGAVILRQPYLLSVLARAEGLGLESYYYCRVTYDTERHFLQEAFTSAEEAERTYARPDGFRRAGAYGVVLPKTVKEFVTLELGLKGPGHVVFRDLQFMNVEAIESSFRGRMVIHEEDFAQLPEEERAGLLVEPDRLLSIAGLRYLLTAYIPWKDWLRPMTSWGTFLVLILMASFSIAVIMRREWVDNQRLPLSFAQIPLFFLGSKRRETTDERFLPEGWRNRYMWAGFATTFIWCALRGFHDINSAIPNLDINLRINAYIENPYFSRMLAGLNLEVIALYLGLAMFLEVNVLFSVIVGFFLFRAQYLVGEFYGLTYQAGYPHVVEQRLSGYVVYSVLIVFFSRKYLYRILRSALRGEDRGEEVFSSRGAILLFIAAISGVVLWARAIGMPLGGAFVVYLALLSFGLVAMKLRADCGVPSCVMFPHLMVIVAFTGGMPVSGTQGMMFATFISVIIAYHGFLLIPGMQLEFLELGRRFRLKRSAILTVNVVAIVGGFLVGGWIVLSGVYAKGMDSFPDSADYAGVNAWTSQYGIYHATATLDATLPPEEKGQGAISPGVWAFAYTGGLTFIVTLLRHTFTGFWFHPGGIILGSTWVMYHIWASLFVACVARFTVLKLGGAATVREKLLPFSAGIFLAAVAAQGLFFVIDLFLFYVADSTQLQFGLL